MSAGRAPIYQFRSIDNGVVYWGGGGRHRAYFLSNLDEFAKACRSAIPRES
jgi:hypothetical protein